MTNQLKKPTFRALMVETEPGGEPVELVVDGLLVDQVAATAQLRKRGSTSVADDPIQFVYACTWAALARTGQTELTFSDFLKNCYAANQDKPEVPVDPTQSGQSSDSA